MNLQDARHLINFHYWARNRMLEALEPLSLEQFTQELGGSFGSVRNTAVHTLSAECVWLLRWKGENPPGMLAPVGYSRIMHPGGEVVAARAAGAAGTGYILSTISLPIVRKYWENRQN